MDQTTQEHIGLSKTVSAATTLMDRTGPEHARLSRIANAEAQIDQTEQGPVRVFVTMLPHVVEGHNSVTGISSGSLNSARVTITIVRHVDQLLIQVVHTALSNASPETDSHVIHEVGQIALQHAMMIPPVHDAVSSLRGTTNTSITILQLIRGMPKNAQPTVIESAMRLQNVM